MTTTIEPRRAQKHYGGPWFSRGWGRDPEVLDRPIPEPGTERELAGLRLLNSTDLEIFRHKLDAIADEGRHVFEYLAMSETLQIGDNSTSIFTAQGDMAACATGVYFHALLNYGPIKYSIKHHLHDPTVGVRDGDIFFVNEALAGGVHPMDMFMNMPVFYRGELIAWVGCGGHQGESGSRDPGGFVPTARSRYEEGLKIPPLKVGENFLLKTDHLDFMCNMVRNPRQLALDLKTRVATCMRMRERLLREVEKRGVDFVVAGMREIIVRTGELARQRLRTYNDGTFRALVFLDCLGTEDGLLRIPVTVTKRGDRLLIDYTGASPQHNKGPYHMHWHLVRAVTAVTLCTYIFRGLPINMGLYEPIEVIVPPRSFINADEEVPISGNSFNGRVVVLALHQAAARMIYDSAQGEGLSASMATNNLFMLFGGRDQYGEPVAGASGALNASGQGARPDRDGEHMLGFYWASEVDLLSVEEHEAKFPWLFISRNMFDTNRHGYGKFRGGVGLVDVFTPHNVLGIVHSCQGWGHIYSLNYGLFGGYAAPPYSRLIIKNSDVKAKLARTDLDLTFGLYDTAKKRTIHGDYHFISSNSSAERYDAQTVLIGDVGAGGGWGDVLDREAELVMEDLREGLIDADIARRIYRVAFDAETLLVDVQGTVELRREERETRRARGRRWDDFMADWLQRKPPERILGNYGPWPTPSAES